MVFPSDFLNEKTSRRFLSKCLSSTDMPQYLSLKKALLLLNPSREEGPNHERPIPGVPQIN